MRILVVYHAGFTHIPTVFHYLDSIRRYSSHDVEFFNIDQAYEELPDFSAYGALFLNYCVISVGRIDPPEYFHILEAALQQYAGPKIASIQDEYDFTDRVKAFLQRIDATAVLTCVPPEAVSLVYWEPHFRGVRFETVLTAYVAEELIEDSPVCRPLADRRMPLGYRGRELPYRLGDLGWHKAEIGLRFKDACTARGIECDIAVDEASRHQGDAWLRFVRSCRVMLGTPSGANVFDFDGALHESIKARYRRNPKLTYEAVRAEVARKEVSFDMGQVSARVFECAVSGTAMALLRGNYSGVVDPEEHYVPIETDYSNIDEVLDRIQDLPAMQAMADRTYQHVIGTERNHYHGFVAQIDGLIAELSHPQQEPENVVDLRVTATPLGNDPYMVEKLMALRNELQLLIKRSGDMVKAAADKRLDVVRHPDGTYRVLRLPAA